MPLSRELRSDAYKLYLLIGERDMPSNCTADRLQQRSGLSAERVLAALDLLWNDDAGFIQANDNRRTGERGYFIAPKCRSKSPKDIDTLWNDHQMALEDAGTDVDKNDEDFDPDDDWQETDDTDSEDA